MINKISDVLTGVRTMAIAGHVRPDGDCVGSCMGLYLYLKANYPQIETDVYLEEVRDVFSFIADIGDVKHDWEEGKVYDLFLLLDVSSQDRIGVAKAALDTSVHTVCIDHHVTNQGLCMVNHICPDASSTCEVLYELLDEDSITKEVAEALYTGIVHDTGVFQYSCTSPRTMEIAANLMRLGVPFPEIIRNSFYVKTYHQNQIMGRAILESMLLLDGKCIVSYLRARDLRFYTVTPKDLDGIVNQLQNTRGVEVAIFLYEIGIQEYKVSLRSNGKVNVARTASFFGGGGHVLAAGCTLQGSPHDVVNSLTYDIEKQLLGEEHGV